MAQRLSRLSLVKAALDAFDNFDTPDEVVAAHTRELRDAGRGRAEAAHEPFEYWCAAFETARAAASRDDVKALARRYLCAGRPFQRTRYPIVRGAMKACVHVLWKRLYALETGVGHWDLAPAATARQERSMEYFGALLAEIAAEPEQVRAHARG
jgi:hypothetical protein